MAVPSEFQSAPVIANGRAVVARLKLVQRSKEGLSRQTQLKLDCIAFFAHNSLDVASTAAACLADGPDGFAGSGCLVFSARWWRGLRLGALRAGRALALKGRNKKAGTAARLWFAPAAAITAQQRACTG